MCKNRKIFVPARLLQPGNGFGNFLLIFGHVKPLKISRMEQEKIEWIIKHLRYTQALCEIILETQAEILQKAGENISKERLIKKVHERVLEI